MLVFIKEQGNWYEEKSIQLKKVTRELKSFTPRGRRELLKEEGSPHNKMKKLITQISFNADELIRVLKKSNNAFLNLQTVLACKKTSPIVRAKASIINNLS